MAVRITWGEPRSHEMRALATSSPAVSFRRARSPTLIATTSTVRGQHGELKHFAGWLIEWRQSLGAGQRSAWVQSSGPPDLLRAVLRISVRPGTRGSRPWHPTARGCHRVSSRAERGAHDPEQSHDRAAVAAAARSSCSAAAGPGQPWSFQCARSRQPEHLSERLSEGALDCQRARRRVVGVDLEAQQGVDVVEAPQLVHRARSIWDGRAGRPPAMAAGRRSGCEPPFGRA